MIVRQRWLLGFAILFTSIAFSVRIVNDGFHIVSIGFAMQDAPVAWMVSLAASAVLWAGYFRIRRRLRTAL